MQGPDLELGIVLVHQQRGRRGAFERAVVVREYIENLVLVQSVLEPAQCGASTSMLQEAVCGRKVSHSNTQLSPCSSPLPD